MVFSVSSILINDPFRASEQSCLVLLICIFSGYLHSAPDLCGNDTDASLGFPSFYAIANIQRVTGTSYGLMFRQCLLLAIFLNSFRLPCDFPPIHGKRILNF
ncbi:hypothetical protein C8Q75DRAFT_489396 [Abortiporus biennis]|nr:hypothetical protein C8Q75DRAFT_489396 [Abortiporus biennis]